MYFNGQKFRGVLEQLSFTPKFLGLKWKNRLFRVLSTVLLKLKCRWLQIGQPDLKNTKHF